MDLLYAANISLKAYLENYPGNCFNGAVSGNSSTGQYARKHNPWSDFADVPASANKPFSAFPSDFSKLPTVSFAGIFGAGSAVCS